MRSARVTLASVLVALTGAMGCGGDTACFQWRPTEGVCPSQTEALAYMTPAPPAFGGSETCSKVLSVNSEGEFDEDDGICCYDVTLRDTNDNYYTCCGC
jgi:hypothetical protein